MKFIKVGREYRLSVVDVFIFCIPHGFIFPELNRTARRIYEGEVEKFGVFLPFQPANTLGDQTTCRHVIAVSIQTERKLITKRSTPC